MALSGDEGWWDFAVSWLEQDPHTTLNDVITQLWPVAEGLLRTVGYVGKHGYNVLYATQVASY